MRVALLSDIHANYPALKAVLKHTLKQRIDQYWFLGDLVGYGPNPVEALQWLMGNLDGFPAPAEWVMGNHEVMMAELILQGKTGVAEEITNDPLKFQIPNVLEYPNDSNELGMYENELTIKIKKRGESGRENGRIIYSGKSRGQFYKNFHWEDLSSTTPLVAIELNRVEISKHELADAFWRKAYKPEGIFPHEIQCNDVDFVMVHGSQVVPVERYVYGWQNPVLWEDLRQLSEQAEQTKRHRIELLGHTHIQTFIQARPAHGDQDCEIDTIMPTPGTKYPILMDSKKVSLGLINPGSVGQPRDLIPHAAYAVLDTQKNTVTFFRVKYDYRKTYRELTLNYYPKSLALKILNAPPIKGTPHEWVNHYQKVREMIV